jgi:hypothetical protein
LQGDGEESWTSSQTYASTLWLKTKSKIEANGFDFEWSSFLVNLIEASLSKISWQKFQQDVANVENNFFFLDICTWRFPSSQCLDQQTRD